MLTKANVKKVNVNLECIDQRLRQLMDFDRATSYAKQKDSLQKEFESFLASLPGHVTLATVTPRDVCRFLIFKDKDGRFTAMVATISAKRDDFRVDAQYVYLTKRLTLILVSYGPFFTLLDEMASGTSA